VKLRQGAQILLEYDHAYAQRLPYSEFFKHRVTLDQLRDAGVQPRNTVLKPGPASIFAFGNDVIALVRILAGGASMHQRIPGLVSDALAQLALDTLASDRPTL